MLPTFWAKVLVDDILVICVFSSINGSIYDDANAQCAAIQLPRKGFHKSGALVVVKIIVNILMPNTILRVFMFTAYWKKTCINNISIFNAN